SQGQLSAVIDFGDLTSGDPATDLSIAWTMVGPASRSIFRDVVMTSSVWANEDTWSRARGWALLFGLAFLTHSREKGLMRLMGRTTIQAVLGERRNGNAP